MSRIEIGIGAIIVGIAGLGLSNQAAFNEAVLVLGIALFLYGFYQVYLMPNLWLAGTLKRWLKRHYWSETEAPVGTAEPEEGVFYFAFWMADHMGRQVFISREKKGPRNLVAFTAPVAFEENSLRGIGMLAPLEQQRLYEELKVLLASMHLGYSNPKFTIATVQHSLPIDDSLSEHGVTLKASEVVDGLIAARSLVRKAIL